MGALAKAVLYPGSNTLLMNLVTSFGDESLFDQIAAELGIDPNENSSSISWIK
jgi:hypothetical protein